VLAFMESVDGIVIMATNDASHVGLALERRVLLRLDFPRPDADARQQIFETLLPPELPIEAGADIRELAERYDFTGGLIKNTIMVALNRAIARSVEAPCLAYSLLRDAAEEQLRNRLDEYAIVTEGRLTLEDVVLPPDTRTRVTEVLAACRNHDFVLNRWGFGERLVTGRGIVALFDGPPGTGKTLCAEILGAALGLPVSRVNIPSVVSKWVGETEQRLQDVFRRAKAARTLLLFDEADALFGKRVSEVERATDRYANMEVNLLLQEIERYDGIVLLTTNLYSALDEALQRRIMYRITFQDPDDEQRANIWRTLLPRNVPLADDVDFPALGREFELSGGRIKNAVLRAAYRARQEDKASVAMEHLWSAAVEESRGAGKVVRDAGPPPMTRR
jgi:SpoVK/Ycf46/Vps4 family AAA+-type ATPase